MSCGEGNKAKAWKYFYPEGNGKAKKGYVLHHVDETLRHNDIERYYEWNVEDLVMMTNSEHIMHHNEENKYCLGRILTNETKEKISNSLKDYYESMSEEEKIKMSESHKGHESWNKGKVNCFSEESRRKMSVSRIGNKNCVGRKYSDETKKKLSESLKGKCAGLLWWNNGEECIRSRTCPEGYVRGRLKNKK